MASTEPSNPGVDSSPLTADSITTRGLIVGAVSAALLGLGCSYATLVLRGSYMALDFTTPGALVMLLLLVAISSGLLRRVAPRLALTPAELATAHIMLVVASAIPTMGLSAQIIPLIAAPFYLANSVNRWGDTLIPHLPEWACPKDSSAIIGLFEGSARATVPWSDWLPPLLAWLPMIAALYLAMICIMVIIRKQWADNERLPFPVIQLPLDMITGHDSTTQRPFFGQGRLWLGFAVAFIYASMMGVRAHYPQMPLVRDWWWFLMFRRRMWMYVHISWPMLGFFYLVPLDTSFSLWTLNLVAFCIRGVMAVLGIELRETLIFGTGSGLFAHLGFGAMIALVVAGLRVGRFHLSDVWRKAVGRAPEVDDSDEILSYRAATIGLIACLVVMGVWLAIAGMPWTLTLPFLLIMFAIFFGLTRIVTESGMAEAVASTIAPGMSTCIFGTRPWGDRGLAALGLTHVFCSDIRTFVMASTAHSLKLASSVGIGGPKLLGAMLLAVVLSAGTSIWLTLRFAYVEGGTTLHSWFFQHGPNAIYSWTNDKIVNPTPPHLAGIAATSVGALIYFAFTFLRQRFMWWPLHPIALAVAPIWIMEHLWFTCLCAWLAKLLALRYGGMKGYARTRSIFLGFILGQFAANAFWLFVDQLAGVRGNRFFHI